MRITVTDPERLNKLNEDSRNNPDQPCNYFRNASEKVERMLDDKFLTNPYETGVYHYKPHGSTIARTFGDRFNFLLGQSWQTNQFPYLPRHCRIMEKDLLRCAARVGADNIEKNCRIYWEDLIECQFNRKSAKRSKFMRMVREHKKIDPVEPIPSRIFYVKNE